MPVGTVRSRLHYAKRAMRAAIEADARPTRRASGMNRERNVEESSPAGSTRDPMRLRSGSCGLPRRGRAHASTRQLAHLTGEPAHVSQVGRADRRRCGRSRPGNPCLSAVRGSRDRWRAIAIADATVSPSAAAGGASPCRSEACHRADGERSMSCGAFHAGSSRKSSPSPSTARPSGRRRGVHRGRGALAATDQRRRDRVLPQRPRHGGRLARRDHGQRGFEVSEPQAVTVDGVDGFVVDVRLAEARQTRHR